MPVGWVEVNGIALRHARSGNGPAPVVLVHEIGGTLESWDAVAARLDDRCDVLRYDQRGSGLSEKPRGALTMDQLVGDLAALMEQQGMARATLAGGAIGGTVALAFAAAFPERTLAILAMAPATGIPLERRAATHARADQTLLEGQRPGHMARLDRSWPEAIRQDRALFETLRLQRLSTDPFSTAAMLHMLAELEIAPILAAVKAPVTILAGRHDADRPPAGVAEVAANLPQARFETVESGHFMHIHAPRLVADRILGLTDARP